MELAKGLIKTARPIQWAKNGFVFTALFFSEKFVDPAAVAKTIDATACFCLVSSSIYFLNDVMDYEQDRKHPRKKFRPIASDIVPKPLAIATCVLLASISLLGSFVISPHFAAVILMYFFLNLSYSLGLKHVAIIDILIVAFGFMLRAIGGAIAIDAAISAWLIVCALMLTLFITIAKRRLEYTTMERVGGKGRKVLELYSKLFLDQILSVSVAGVLITYSLFTIYSRHSIYLIVTIPIVFIGIFRYLMLIFREQKGEDPTMLVVKDPVLILTMLVWGISSAAILTIYH